LIALIFKYGIKEELGALEPHFILKCCLQNLYQNSTIASLAQCTHGGDH
jgi:hypothetical protein